MTCEINVVKLLALSVTPESLAAPSVMAMLGLVGLHVDRGRIDR